MANSTLQPDMITKEALSILHNNLTFCRQVNRQYDDSNTMGGQKNGGAIRIRLPNKYLTNTGAALGTTTGIDTVESSVTLPAGTQRHVDTNFTTKELTLDIDTFSERIIEPGMSTLASVMDNDVLAARTLEVANSVGTPGTTPATAKVILDAAKYQSYFATPRAKRFLVLNPDANAAMVDGLKGLFNSSDKISDQFKMGLMANNVLGFSEISETQSVSVHTTGSRLLTDSMLIDGDILTEGGNSINVDGVNGTETVTAGDVFTVAGCYSVNPETKVSTGQLQQFTVDADLTAAGNQFTALTFSPSVYTTASGALKNVTGATAAAAFVDGSAVTWLGEPSTAYAQNLAFHKDSIILATTDLEMPEGVHFSSRQTMDGISMRLVRQYRIGTDDIPTRIDILYGSVTARAETACRVWG